MISPARATGIPTLAAVPPPHGVTGRPTSVASAITAATSSIDPGNTAASGVRPSTTYGESSIPVRTLAAPTAARSLSSSASGTGVRCPALEALGEALFFDRVRPVRDGPDFDAGLLGGEHLAWIAEPGSIECVLEALHERKIRDRENERHEIGFLQADAVLAGDRPTDVRADLHDLGAGLDDPRFLARLARIVEDVGMEVAVAGVEHVADAETRGGDDLVHSAEDVRQLRARDDAVHHHVGGRHAAVRPEGRLASLPQQLTLGLGARRAHLARARLAARGDDV